MLVYSYIFSITIFGKTKKRTAMEHKRLRCSVGIISSSSSLLAACTSIFTKKEKMPARSGSASDTNAYTFFNKDGKIIVSACSPAGCEISGLNGVITNTNRSFDVEQWIICGVVPLSCMKDFASRKGIAKGHILVADGEFPFASFKNNGHEIEIIGCSYKLAPCMLKTNADMKNDNKLVTIIDQIIQATGDRMSQPVKASFSAPIEKKVIIEKEEITKEVQVMGGPSFDNTTIVEHKTTVMAKVSSGAHFGTLACGTLVDGMDAFMDDDALTKYNVIGFCPTEIKNALDANRIRSVVVLGVSDNCDDFAASATGAYVKLFLERNQSDGKTVLVGAGSSTVVKVPSQISQRVAHCILFDRFKGLQMFRKFFGQERVAMELDEKSPVMFTTCNRHFVVAIAPPENDTSFSPLICAQNEFSHVTTHIAITSGGAIPGGDVMPGCAVLGSHVMTYDTGAIHSKAPLDERHSVIFDKRYKSAQTTMNASKFLKGCGYVRYYTEVMKNMKKPEFVKFTDDKGSEQLVEHTARLTVITEGAVVIGEEQLYNSEERKKVQTYYDNVILRKLSSKNYGTNHPLACIASGSLALVDPTKTLVLCAITNYCDTASKEWAFLFEDHAYANCCAYVKDLLTSMAPGR